MKKVMTLILSFGLVLGSVVPSAAAGGKKVVPVETYEPAQPSTINGVPENEMTETPDEPVYYTDTFIRYDPSVTTSVTYYKLIASSYVDNRGSSTPFALGLNITQSEKMGSEWNGQLSFQTSFKAGILGKVETTLSVGVKETRETNEAVGVTGSMSVPAGKQGKLEAFYGGASSSGSVKWSRYDSYTGITTEYYTPVDVKVHKSALVVNFKPTAY